MAKKHTVLIIEDSPFLAARLKKSLEIQLPLGAIFHAHSYAEAEPILQANVIALILLDIHLPGINGIEVLRKLRKERPSIIVIMLSNQSDELYRNVCLSIGAAYFFDKSTEFHLVAETISSLF